MPIKHLAIILDGNRRWAKERGLPSLEGHRRGYDNVKAVGLAALDRGIEQFTAFAFSTENWNRSAEEVGYLMDLLHQALTNDLGFYQKNDIRLRVIGRREGLSEKLIEAIDRAERETSSNARGQFNVCINYGGRAEITDAARRIVSEGMPAKDVTEELISKKIWMAGIPDPDLIIRTSGEQRLSGFLAWSGVYSELLFVDAYWPDFSEKHLDEAIAEYERRERRFGK